MLFFKKYWLNYTPPPTQGDKIYPLSSLSLALISELPLLIMTLTSRAISLDQANFGSSSVTIFTYSITLLSELTRFLHAPQFTSSRIRPILVFGLVFIALLSLLSNALIIHVVRINKHMRSTTNYLILNMACGDLLVTLVSSMNNVNRLYHGMAWIGGLFGDMTCKTRYFVVFGAMFCSIFSLVTITFDRCMAVLCPYSYKYNSRWTKYTLPLIWLVSLAVPSVLVLRKFANVQIDALQDNQTYCIPLNSVNEGAMMTICGHGIPHVAMVIMYSMIAYKLWIRRVPGESPEAQGRPDIAQETAKKVTRMIIFVLFVFEICWGPMFGFNIIPCLIPRVRKVYNPVATAVVSMAMCSNGLFNALIYFAFSGQFRRAFKNTLRVNLKLSEKESKNQLNIQTTQ